jgi:phospholipid transport system substrate-binding protein
MVMRSLGLTLALGVLLARAAHGAAAAPDGAVNAVRDTLGKARALVLTDDPREQKLAGLRELARHLMDTREMGRRALGPRFAEQPAAQQEEFLELFDELIVRSYLQKLLFFRQPRFAFGEEETKHESVIVHTRILTDKDEFFVDYEMRQRDGAWVASDVVIENVSLTQNYAQQFRELLQSRSFDELLVLLRGKVAGLRAKSDS